MQRIAEQPPDAARLAFLLGPRKAILVVAADEALTCHQQHIIRLSEVEFYPTGGSGQVARLLRSRLPGRIVSNGISAAKDGCRLDTGEARQSLAADLEEAENAIDPFEVFDLRP